MPISLSERLLVSYARHIPLRFGKLRLVDSLWRKAAGEGTTQRLAHLNYGGFKMQCDLREMLQRQFYFFGTYFLEEPILASWQRMAIGARIIFDVGANAGIYGLAALAVQRNAIVHAFEPTVEIAARLRKTVEMNGLEQLHVHEQAVSDKQGEAALIRFRGEFDTNEGMNFISSDVDGSYGERVRTISLDQFCQDNQIERIDLMKLDIQGHEYAALTGARRMIETGRVGTIFTELNWAKQPGALCPATESIRLLQDAGYRFSKPERRLRWREAGDWLRSLSDVVACQGVAEEG